MLYFNHIQLQKFVMITSAGEELFRISGMTSLLSIINASPLI